MVATDQGVPKPFNSQVEVRVVVEDINDNRPVFTSKETELVLSLYTQPGPILSLKVICCVVKRSKSMTIFMHYKR